jgi:UDP-N-acetylmuramate dehydrogenase
MIKRNILLKEMTTLRVGGKANYFAEVQTTDELITSLNFAKSKNLDILVIGDCSNIVIPDEGFDGIVIKVLITEIIITKETPDLIFIKAGAGVNWDSFVDYSVSKGYWGIENLSLIPGTVGAFPVQNVGAYGQVANSVVSEVHVIERESNKLKVLTNAQCEFGWRNSIFNTRDKNRYIIIHVIFKLNKKYAPKLTRIDLRKEVIRLNRFSEKELTTNKIINQTTIRQAVINLRSSGEKLPNSTNEYNTGTFFRAQRLKKSQFYKLAFKLLFSYGILTTVRALGYRLKYGVGDSYILPSALLLNEIKDIKSINENFELFKKNPAVLIHNGKGTHKELINFINDIKKNIFKKSGIQIPVEPEVIGENIN